MNTSDIPSMLYRFKQNIIRIALSYLLVLLTIEAQAKEPEPLRFKVAQVKGNCICSMDRQVWSPLKKGDIVAPGCTIQTSNNYSFVDLEIPQQKLRTLGPAFYPLNVNGPTYRPVGDTVDSIRLYENSMLTVGEIYSQRTKTGMVAQVHLTLLSGVMFDNAKRFPTVSEHEIKLPYGTANSRGALSVFYASGPLKVCEGLVRLAVAGADKPAVREIPPAHQFDPSTGMVSNFEIPHVTICFPQYIEVEPNEHYIPPGPYRRHGI
jgi:hypothetical protein